MLLSKLSGGTKDVLQKGFTFFDNRQAILDTSSIYRPNARTLLQQMPVAHRGPDRALGQDRPPAKVCTSASVILLLNFQAFIKSAASAADLITAGKFTFLRLT